MQIIDKHIYEWQRPVLTEKYTNDLLKEDPLNADVSYLSVPWSTLIDKLEFGSAKDKAGALTNLEKLKKLKLKNAFTVCQHDRFHLILPTLKEAGVNLLFASHMVNKPGYTTKDFFLDPGERNTFGGIRIETIFLAPVFVGEPKTKKDILYSFIGSYGKKHISNIRKKIFNDPHETNAVVVERKGWQFDLDVYGEQILNNPSSSVQKYINEEKSKFYEETLSRSRFSLCPSGTGPTSIRFLESLGSGAIPVILADTMMLPKIKKVNWDDCTIKIPEKNYNNLRDTLSKITPKQENTMRQKGLEAYKLCTGKNFIKNIRDYFDETP
tara:strand:+ start:45 stop:1019 length:975 start_codon:yes stop_codon:yes gene_type:complete